MLGDDGDPLVAGDGSFRRLLESANIGFWHIAVDGRTSYLNPAMCRMLQLSSAADIGDATFHRFFTAASLERMRVEHEKRQHGVTSTYEVELLGMQGGRLSVMISGAPVHGTDGALVGLIGTFTDISELRHAESRLRIQDEQLRSMFAASIDAMSISKSGVHLLMNPAFLQMFGYERVEDLVGRSILDLIAPEQRALIAERVRQRSLGTADLSRYETRGLRSDGSEFDMEVQVSTYIDAGEVHTVVILRDVSEMRLLEQQLRQAQKMDALGRLAGGVAHDFNNLLTVVLGCGELMRPHLPAAGALRTNADLIAATAGRAAGLTRQLLAISRRHPVELRVVDPNATVAEMGDLLRRLVGEHLTFSVDAGAIRTVRLDPGQLQQVLMNLCVNARDAMPDGGRLTITTRDVHLDEPTTRLLVDVVPGDYVCLTVSDTGCGMDEATIARLFEPFFTTKPHGQGTGLGLSIVYGIVRQCGGHITVASTLGNGSAFSVYLPVANVPGAPAASVEAPVTITRGSGTVLLVEDEKAVRELATEALTAAGWHVRAAGDGASALAQAAGQPIDLVISDVVMPGMSGWELCRRLDRERPGLPVIFISGYAGDQTPPEIASRPRTIFLGKPFRLAELVEVARRMQEGG